MMLRHRTKSNMLFTLLLTFFGLMITWAVFVIVRSYPIVYGTLRSAFGLMDHQSCDCSMHAPFLSTHPYLGGFIVLFTILAAAFIIHAGYSLIRQMMLTRRFFTNMRRRSVPLPSKLKRIARDLGIEQRIVVVRSPSHEVFCSGTIRPTIYISLPIVHQVTSDELRAIIIHELSHLRSRDPLRILLSALMSRSMFFVPGLSSLIRHFLTDIELAADDRATERLRSTHSLSSALLAMIDLQHHDRQRLDTPPASATFLNSLEVRIDRLLETPIVRSHRLPISRIALGLVIISAIATLSFHGNHLLAKTTELEYNNLTPQEAVCPMMDSWEEYLYSDCHDGAQPVDSCTAPVAADTCVQSSPSNTSISTEGDWGAVLHR